MGIIFGLITAFIQALSHIVLKKSYQELTPAVAFFFDSLFGILIWIPFSLITGANIYEFWRVLPYALISAVFAEAFVFYILSKGALSLTNTVFFTYPLFTILFSRFINYELLTFSQLIAVSIVIGGLLILSFPNKWHKEELRQKTILLWPLLAAVSVGVSDSLSKNILSQTSTATFLFTLAIAQLPVSILYLKFENKFNLASTLRQKDVLISVLASFLMVISLVFFWITFSLLPASIASPLTGISPVVVLILAKIYLKESILKKDLVASLVILGGITYLSQLI